MKERVIKVRGPNGEIYTMDLVNETVSGPGGWKADMRSLTQSDVHIAAALPNFVQSYANGESIGDILLPPTLVDKPTDYFYTSDKDNTLNAPDDDVVKGDAPINTVSPQLSNTQFTCVDRGLAGFVNLNATRAADQGLDPYLITLSMILEKMDLLRELRCKTLLFDNASTFLSYKTTLGATAKWNGGTASDPVSNLYTAAETALAPITHVGLSERTWHTLLKHADVKALSIYKEGQMTLPGPEAGAMIADRLGLPGARFVIGRKRYKSAASTYSYVWGNDVICLHQPVMATQTQNVVCTARTFRWNAPGSVRGFEIREWDEPGKGQRGGRMIAVVTSEVQYATAPETGHLIVGAYQ